MEDTQFSGTSLKVEENPDDISTEMHRSSLTFQAGTRELSCVSYICKCVEPLFKGHCWDPLAVLYREVSLIQRKICTQLYLIGHYRHVLIREVSLIQSILYREVSL